MVDLVRSRRFMEEVLASTPLLNESQKRNVRLKAADLAEERLEWACLPFRILVEYNRRCNGRCVHCDVDHEVSGELPLDLVDRLFGEVGWGSMEIQPFAGGEPTLAPRDHFAGLARR